MRPSAPAGSGSDRESETTIRAAGGMNEGTETNERNGMKKTADVDDDDQEDVVVICSCGLFLPARRGAAESSGIWPRVDATATRA